MIRQKIVMKEGRNVIEIKNLSHIYHPGTEHEVRALNHINLRIEDGEHVAVLGRNGCGKSTLAKHLNGLLLPTEGSVMVDEYDTTDEEHALDILQRVGMVFQNPDNQLVATTVLEEIAFGPENLGLPREVIFERVDEALKLVQMEDFRDAMPHHLSGGQKQRIAIAGVLAVRPKIMILDESTAMLDPRGRREVLSVVERLHRERGMTVVMITQYMEEVAPCDRVVVMDGGRIALAGTPRQIFRDPDALRAAGLDTPEAVQMRDALTRGGVPLQGDPITIEELADAICQSLSNN